MAKRESFWVKNMDSQKKYLFKAVTPYEAIVKMQYTLGLKDEEAKRTVINKTPSGHHLWFEYGGETYAVRM